MDTSYYIIYDVFIYIICNLICLPNVLLVLWDFMPHHHLHTFNLNLIIYFSSVYVLHKTTIIYMYLKYICRLYLLWQIFVVEDVWPHLKFVLRKLDAPWNTDITQFAVLQLHNEEHQNMHKVQMIKSTVTDKHACKVYLYIHEFGRPYCQFEPNIKKPQCTDIKTSTTHLLYVCLSAHT